jgi:hypothetical protein
MNMKTKSKKVKVGTILDKRVVRRLKERAVREGKAMSTLIQEAIQGVDEKESFDTEQSRNAMDRFLAVTYDDFRRVMDEDVFDQ